jgi:hypothetical protein
MSETLRVCTPLAYELCNACIGSGVRPTARQRPSSDTAFPQRGVAFEGEIEMKEIAHVASQASIESSLELTTS